ncbi:MAG: hypothetical protein JSS82_05885 [Bacteroidetes bacterium]|nr:hypothetical protein [Bacteroidota bacterium]
MKANEFDKAIRRAYEQGSFEYQPSQWERMAQQLTEAEGRKRKSLAWLPFLSYAASVVFMVSVGAFLMRDSITRNTRVSGEAASDRNIVLVQPEVKQDALPQAGTNAQRPALRFPTPKAPTAQPSLIPQAQAPLLAVAVPQYDEKLYSNADIVTPNAPRTTFKAPKYIDFTSPIYEPMEREHTGKTIISVSGGLNYGATNSGYSLGFTAFRKLGENIFVEGDFAFVNNLSGKRTELATENAYALAANATAQSASPTLGGGAAKPAATTHGTAARPSAATDHTDNNVTAPSPVVPVPVRGSHYNMYYAQVTPTVGYNVFKNLALSGGADVQRLLQNDQLMTVSENVVDAKLIPNYDFGFVGKTEYAISKQLKATVYYRHGLNNAISGSDKYIDRNYLQLQLKFSILNR